MLIIRSALDVVYIRASGVKMMHQLDRRSLSHAVCLHYDVVLPKKLE